MLLAIAVGAVVVTAMGIGTIVWRSSSRSSDAATISPLAVELGCASCHSVDGTRREGPTWQGLAGSDVTLDDGTVVGEAAERGEDLRIGLVAAAFQADGNVERELVPAVWHAAPW